MGTNHRSKRYNATCISCTTYAHKMSAPTTILRVLGYVSPPVRPVRVFVNRANTPQSCFGSTVNDTVRPYSGYVAARVCVRSQTYVLGIRMTICTFHVRNPYNRGQAFFTHKATYCRFCRKYACNLPSVLNWCDGPGRDAVIVTYPITAGEQKYCSYTIEYTWSARGAPL